MNNRRVLSAIPAAFAVLTFSTPVRASDDAAAVAFARYAAAQKSASSWKIETVEIRASLPKLAKTGRLRAIRRLLPLGRPEYRVLEITGDPLVKQQVIVRYLNAELRASELPAGSVAVTPANYKFRYLGRVANADRVAYAFQITPLSRREGLIKGELWLDGETGLPLRQSGYFVKKPSIFVKRLEVTRESSLRDGLVEVRTTHVSVLTRLVGRAELTIEERPVADDEDR